MDFTLDQLLTIVGQLDDNPGFDTARERFRRFLHDRMTALEPARQIIQQCRQQSGAQSHRVLQDVIALLGRLLGFETAFGRYQAEPGEFPNHGTWHARHRLHITLIVCTDQTPTLDLEALSRAIGDGAGAAPRIALLVMTPLYAGRSRLEQSMAEGRFPNLRLVSLPGLLRLAGMVDDRQLAHDDVLQVLNPAVSLDARIDLLERAVTGHRRATTADFVATIHVDGEPRERRYWVNAIRVEPFTPTERVVRSLIGTRQILGIDPASGLEHLVRTGDVICVFIAGRGIVAHAKIAAILTDGSRAARDSQQSTHVLRLTDVTVYDTAVVPNQELARKLDIALQDDATAVTVPISPREFESITAHALPEAG